METYTQHSACIQRIYHVVVHHYEITQKLTKTKEFPRSVGIFGITGHEVAKKSDMRLQFLLSQLENFSAFF